MLQITIESHTTPAMLRAIRAACNELLGETHTDLTTQAAEHNSRAVQLHAAAEAETDMAAAALSAHNSQTAPTVAEIPAPAAEELDSAGHPWNPELHASTKSKNADGTWKKRRGAAQVAEATAAWDAGIAQAAATPPVPPVPPAAPTAEPIMPKIFALITSQIVTINQAVEAAQAEGYADLGANGLGGAPREAQEAVLRKLEG